MQVKEAVEEYHYAISRHSEQTQSWYLFKLNVFALWCETEMVTLEKIKPSDILLVTVVVYPVYVGGFENRRKQDLATRSATGSFCF